MVRHEAAEAPEAMGAILSVQSIPTLKEFLNDQRQEVRETCEIALAKVEWDNSEEGKTETTKSQGETPLVYQYTVSCGFLFIYLFFRQFTSEDPAPPVPSSLLRALSPSSTSYTNADVLFLTTTLLDPSLSLFVRYRALFTLRNIGTPAVIDALSSAKRNMRSSR